MHAALRGMVTSAASAAPCDQLALVHLLRVYVFEATRGQVLMDFQTIHLLVSRKFLSCR